MRSLVEAVERRRMMAANPFTPGDLLVYRVGTGATLSNAATAVFLDEYTSAGGLVQSIPLSSTGAAALTASGTAASEGQLALSPDGSTVALTGYTAAAGGATQGTDNGTVAVVGTAASPTYYVLPSASVVAGNNVRSAVVDGNNLYVASAATGVQYAPLSSLVAGGTVNAATTQVAATTKTEDLQVFNGQLYFSSQKATGYGASGTAINGFGGEPTAAATPASVAVTPANNYSFVLEHLGGGTSTAADTLYVADSTAGVEKFSLVSGAWTARGMAAVAGGAYGLSATVDAAGTVHLVASNAGGLYALSDATGQAGTLAGGPTKVVTAAAGTAFDGVVPTPDDGVGAITGLGGATSYAQGNAALAPAAAAAFADASNFDGATLLVSGGLAGDTLAISAGNGITVTGTAVSLNGTQVATTSGGSGATPLAVAFNPVGGSPVAAAAVQAVLRQVSFTSAAPAVAGTRTLAFQVVENGGASDAAATRTVTVVASSTAPSINAPGTLNLPANAGPQTVALSGIGHAGGTGTITVTVTSDAPSVVANTGAGAAAVSYASPAATGSLTFTPVAGASGTAHLTVTVTDGGGSTAVSETVNVVGPPALTVPAAQGVVAGAGLTFAAAGGNGVAVSDPGVGTGNAQLGLSVAHGTLTLGTASGLTFTAGGSGQASLVATGTVANLNAALAGLAYAPAAGYAGADALQVAVSDLGNTPLGTVQTRSGSVALTVSAAPAVLLNEIEANPPGMTENRYEYVEISGPPGTPLSNVYFVAIDGTTGTTGNADVVVNLSAFAIGSDGLLVIESAPTVGHPIPAATTLVADPAYFTQTGGFPNGALSFFLYACPNAPVVAGTDYDANDDGTLDHLPAGATALDDVAIPNTNNPTDLAYGNVTVTEVGTKNKGTADAVTRFPGTSATVSADWYGGEMYDTGNIASTLEYDVTRPSANQPANAVLTPGQPNYPSPPAFAGNGFFFTTPTTAAAGSAVGQVAATATGSDTLAYALSGTTSASFAIGTTGAVTVASGATLTAGTYTLTVTARDVQSGVTSSAPVTVTVTGTVATTVTVATGSNPVAFGQPTTFTATVAPAGATRTGFVQFQVDGGDVGAPVALNGNAAAYTTTALLPGAHSVKAVYGGDATYAGSTSAAVSQTVTATSTTLTGAALYLRLDPDGKNLDVYPNATGTGAYAQQVYLPGLGTLVANATALVVDFSAGDPLPVGGLNDTGGTLLVVGSLDPDTVTTASGTFTLNGAQINTAGVAKTTFTPGPGPDSFSLAGGTLYLTPAAGTAITVLTSLSLSGGAKLAVVAPAHSVILTSGLSLAQSGTGYAGTLDLANGDLVVRGGSLATLTAAIKAGLTSAGANGGILSSTAAADATRDTALGVIQNSVDGTTTGSPIYSSTSAAGEFDGISTLDTDVLVKFTHVGDANLDGKVDGQDYARADAGYASAGTLTGWFNGDFNYDGKVDGSDYTLADNAFDTQVAPIVATASAPIATPAASVSSVAESTRAAAMPETVPARNPVADAHHRAVRAADLSLRSARPAKAHTPAPTEASNDAAAALDGSPHRRAGSAKAASRGRAGRGLFGDTLIRSAIDVAP